LLKKIKKTQLDQQKLKKLKNRIFFQGEGVGTKKVGLSPGFWGRLTRWKRKKFEIRMSVTFAVPEL
jgi:hypothetical protein